MENQTEQIKFNYADPASVGEYLPCLKLEASKQYLVSFLENVPGMQSPPFVFCRVHWNSEMGENGRRFQCFGGQCCEQITWQKGFGGAPGEFKVNKATKRYYIPVVHYEQNPKDPTSTVATVKYIDMTFTAFSTLSSVINQNTEGLSFFDRDVLIDVKAGNGPITYVFNKRETLAKWKENPVFKQQVEEQLPNVAKRLLNALPQMMDEHEFMQMKPILDAKVQAAMNSREPQQGFDTLPTQTVNGFNEMAQQPQPAFNTMQTVGVSGMAQPFAQPQVNIPIQPQVQVQQPQVNVPVQPQVQEVQPQPQVQVQQQAQEVQQQDAKPSFELPQTSLSFDPTALLK